MLCEKSMWSAGTWLLFCLIVIDVVNDARKGVRKRGAIGWWQIWYMRCCNVDLKWLQGVQRTQLRCKYTNISLSSFEFALHGKKALRT